MANNEPKETKKAETPEQTPQTEGVATEPAVASQPTTPQAEAPATPKKAEPAKKKESKSELNKLKGEIATLTATLEKAQAELDEQKEKYMRMMAEYDNFRRRTAKEKEGIYTDAVFDVLKNLLPVVDNLERASVAQGDAEQIAKGLEMTLHSVEALLSQQGVEAYGAVGDTFDPNFHNAVMHDEDPALPEGYISDVFMKGYKKGDRVLRYAMVKVIN